MKNILAVFLYLNLLFALTGSSRIQRWRGIVPLHSTRADVEQLLGAGTNECKCAYYLEDANLFFQYSTSDCKNGGSGGWNIPQDTVIRFTVVPKPKPQLSDLNIDQSKFKKKQDPEIEGNMYYINEEEGFSLEVYQGTVQAFFYQPSEKDKHLRCP